MKYSDYYKEIGGGDFYELIKPFKTSFGYTIPKGFIWDGMTMHQFAFIEKMSDRVFKISLEHDHPYVYEGDIEFYGKRLTRAEVDRRFLQNLLAEPSISVTHAIYIYLLVRIFGWIKWRRRSKQND